MNPHDVLRVLLLAAALATTAGGKECLGAGGGITTMLFCYYSDARHVDPCRCSHVILPETTPQDQIKALVDGRRVKVLLTVREFNENLIHTLKATKIFGLEVQLKKLSAKQDISDFLSTVRAKLGADLFIALSVPAKPESLAKYYDFKALSTHVNAFMLQTHFLGASHNVTFHPSRLSGLWDVQNTDSVVDLVTGLGAPLSKLVVATPVQGFTFVLQDEAHTAPGSPALALSTSTRDELCTMLEGDRWTLERDQDQAGPYIFRKNKWVAFEDATSMDIKAKYVRIRGLAGLALKDVSQDGGAKCGETLLESAFNGLAKQARAPRGAVLHSLEREMLQPVARPFDNIQVSPYRISRIIDTEGQVHAIRQDSRTEFKCSRQGYFVHPRSCNRFYRCVKFDQQSDEFSVFEFDCPAGLAFDERVEVCVWPGSLSDGSACAGSSEIAPVPNERFTCPEAVGYYADPENCRWFFACMDHGKSPLTAYEFRCPYGLVFDQENLVCEWNWLVPRCTSGSNIHATIYGGYPTENAAARDGAIDLELYDGLGTLKGVRLGGLSGPLHATEAITYSNAQSAESTLSGGRHAIGLSLHANNDPAHSSFFNDASNKERIDYSSGTITAPIYGTRTDYLNPQDDALKYSNTNRFIGTHQRSQPEQSSINIVAGGESGVAAYAQNVDLLQHGAKIGLASIQPSTLVSSTTFSPIPTVTNVPIPAFPRIDTYNDFGVIANLPNLQHKLENPTIINQQLHQLGDINRPRTVYSFANTSFDTNGYAINADIPSQFDGYHYEKPTTPLLEGANRGFVSYDVHSYQTPQVMANNHNLFEQKHFRFEHKPLRPEVMRTYTYEKLFESYSNDKPFGGEGLSLHAKTKQLHVQQPSINLQAANNEGNVTHLGYTYDKPAVPFVKEQAYSGYQYDQPAIKFEAEPVKVVRPALTYQEIALQPPNANRNIQPSVQTRKEGYYYEKPVIKFEENPPSIKPPVREGYHYKPPTYQQNNTEQDGYRYDKPAIRFEEKPIPSVTVQPVTNELKYKGYRYEKPEIKFEEAPIVSVISNQPVSDKLQPEEGGYHYNKPGIKFEENPIAPATVQPIIQEVQRAGYRYDKPAVEFEEKPIIPAITYQQINLKPEANHENQPGYHYEKPATTYQQIHIQPVQTYQTINHETPTSALNIVHHAYQYERPMEEKPIRPATTYQQIFIQPAVTYHETKYVLDNKPADTPTYSPPQHVPQPVPISSNQKSDVDQNIRTQSYHEIHHQPAIVNYHQVKPDGYYYEKPKVVFEEKQTIPSTVYQEINLHPVVPIYKQMKQDGYLYGKPNIAFVEQPTPSSSVFFKPSEVKPLVLTEQKPSYKQIVQAVTPKPIITSSFSIGQYSQGYHYNKPAIAFEDKPLINVPPTIPPQQVNKNPVLNYIPPRPLKAYLPAPTTAVPPPKTYLPQLPTQTEVPARLPAMKPIITPHVNQPIATNYPTYYDTKEIVEEPLIKTTAYQTGYGHGPAIKFEDTRLQPTYPATIASILPEVEPDSFHFFSYESKKTHPSNPQQVQESLVPVVQPIKTITSKPIVRYQFSSLDYPPVQPTARDKLLIYVPDRNYLPVTTTRRPLTVAQKTEYLPPSPPKRVYLPTTTTTTERYEAGPSDEYLPVMDILKIKTSTPANEYLATTRRVVARPSTTTAAPTTKPSREYLPVKLSKQPSSEYLPVQPTPVSREYLPAKQIENYEFLPTEEVVLPSRRPKVIKVIKTRPIVKVNDFHPILSAKLGAQCTCTSNTLTLRRNSQKASKTQSIDDGTTRISDEEEYVTNGEQFDSQYDESPKKQSVIIVAEEDDYISQDDEIRKQDIAKAVHSGLKLVKSAVKQGVKEGVQEALSSKDFDRYDSGGVRARSESLHGSVDCQRAGLFRHPRHCNKFYACRWEQGKKKFTLHVFNCPVHLTFDNNLGACNWPSQGPACVDNTLLPSN